MENKFFLHRIMHKAGAWDKGIEVHDTLNSAIQSYHARMAYGYDNPKFTDVDYVACMITDLYGNTVAPFKEHWIRPEPEPTPQTEPVETEEPETEPEPEGDGE